MEGLYGKKSVARELSAKQKKALFLKQDFFLGGREWKGFIMQIDSSSFGEGDRNGEGPHLTYCCSTRKFQTG